VQTTLALQAEETSLFLVIDFMNRTGRMPIADTDVTLLP
jgi:hypothetical protein